MVECLFMNYVVVGSNPAAGKFSSSKSSSLAKSLSTFLILLLLQCTLCKYLTRHHLKHLLHLLPSVFLILINAFWGWSNCFGNLIQLLPTKGLYFEILMLRSMTKSTVQP